MHVMGRNVVVSNRRRCGLCRRGIEANDMCGRLWVDGDCVAHHKCMQYSARLSQYKTHTFGGFYPKEVMNEIKRGKDLKCYICKKDGSKASSRGATCGCAITRCNATYHYPCAKEKAITVRLIHNKTQYVHYRVFCTEKHKELYEMEHQNESYSSDTVTSDEDTEQMVNEHRPSSTATRQRSKTLSPVVSNGAVKTRHQHRKRTHSLLSLCGTGDCTTSSRWKSPKNMCEQDTGSNSNEHPLVLGTIKKCPNEDISRDSTETSLTEMLPQNHDYVLCFIENNMAVLSDKHKDEIKVFAEKVYGVMQKHVIVWIPKVDGSVVASDNIIYFIHDITTALREHNYPDLERLLFGLSQDDIDMYEKFHHLHKSFGGEKQELVQTMMHDVIKEDLLTAGMGSDVKIGTLCRVKQKHVSMLYLHVCNLTDPVCRIRSRLCHKQQSFFRWTKDTYLTDIMFSANTTKYFREQEADELKFWLERNIDPEVNYYVDFENNTQKCISIMDQLKAHFRFDAPQGKSSLVFLGPVDFAEKTTMAYVRSCTSEVLEKVITPDKDLYVVLEIKVSHTACHLSDLTPVLKDNIDVEVYSFADPDHLPVTCVLLHYKIRQEAVEETCPRLDDIWESKCTSPALIVTVCNVRLSGIDFNTIKPNNDVVDDVIRAYILLLVQEHGAAAIDGHVMNMLLDKPSIASLPKGVFRKSSLVLAPFNMTGDHWELLAFYPDDRSILYVNPFGEPPWRIKVIEDSWAIVVKRYPGEVLQGTWVVSTCPHTKQQDGHSCGVLVMQFAELILTNQKLVIYEEIDSLRRLIAQRLLKHNQRKRRIY